MAICIAAARPAYSAAPQQRRSGAQLARGMGVWAAAAVLAASASVALAVPAGGRLRQLREPELCCGWEELREFGGSSGPAAAAPIKFVVRVRESPAGLAQVRQAALDVSTPTHERYGHYLTQGEIDAMTAPTAADTAAVEAWLSGTPAGGGCSTTRVRKGRIFEVGCAHGAAERLLQTSIRSIHNPRTGQHLLRAADCWFPQSVRAVFGLHGLPLPPPSPPRHYHTAAPVNDSAVTPTAILDAYNVTGQVRVAISSPNSQAVVSFGAQTMNASDLQQFLRHFPPRDDGPTPPNQVVSKFVGDLGGDTSGALEASLDIQYIMGIGRGVRTEFWRFSSPADLCGQFHNWTQHLLADDESTPLVNSVSYGWQGNLTLIGCPPESRMAIDDDFAMLAAKGITLIFASGDYGSGSGGGNGGLCIAAIDRSIDGLTDTALVGSMVANTSTSSACACHALADGRPYTYTPSTGAFPYNP